MKSNEYTNLRGPFLTTQAFLPGMIQKNRGDIIMISSMSGKKGDLDHSAYNTSKFGLQGFSQALMYEVRQYKSQNTGSKFVKGLTLHANDIASTVLHIVSLPGRTMIRDMDIYGTNP